MDRRILSFAGGVLLDASGTQRAWPRLAVLGHPVKHSLSPALHRAALNHRGMDGDYGAVDVKSDELRACLAAAHGSGVEGLNITLPHKTHALRESEVPEASALAIGAANTLLRGSRAWRAHNTDAAGLCLALRRGHGDMVQSTKSSAVLGAGGASRAAVAALRELGCSKILVLAREPSRAHWASAAGAEARRWDDLELGEAQLVVQTTPLGLRPEDPSPVAVQRLRPDALVVDLCYGAHRSRLLHEAVAHGCTVMDGLPMLVCQAALAFALWFGDPPPLQAMAQAAGIELDRPASS